MADSQKIRFGILPKMLIAMLMIAVIPLGATWLINSQATSQRIAGYVNQRLELIAGGLQGYVDTWVQMNLRMLRHSAKTPAIRSMDASRQNPMLALITQEYDWNYLAFTVAPTGENIGRSDGKATRFYGDRGYVQQVLRGAERGQQVLIGKTSGKPALVLSVPIQGDANQIQGVMAIAMTIADLSDRVTQVRIGETGQAFLVDEAGRVIAHQSDAYTKERRDLSGHPAVLAAKVGDAGTLIYRGADGEQRIAAYRNTAYGWTLVTEQAHGEAFAEVARANRNALILLGITLLAVVAVAFVLSRRLSGPLQHLTAVANNISHGKLDQDTGYLDRTDEIGALAQSIDRLGTSVRLALQRIARYRKAANAA